MQTQIGRTLSKAEWARATRPPVEVQPREKRKGSGRLAHAFYFFDQQTQRWECEAGLTRGEARAKLQARLGRKIQPGGALNSRKQRALRRDDKRRERGETKQTAPGVEAV